MYGNQETLKKKKKREVERIRYWQWLIVNWVPCVKAIERLVYTAATICQNIANKVHMLNLSLSFQSPKKDDHI